MIAAQTLCQSNELQKRELEVNIIGQLGILQRTFPDECLNTLLEGLETESNSQVSIAQNHVILIFIDRFPVLAA